MLQVRKVSRRMMMKMKNCSLEASWQPKAGRIGQLEFRITGRQPMATYLAHPQ